MPRLRAAKPADSLTNLLRFRDVPSPQKPHPPRGNHQHAARSHVASGAPQQFRNEFFSESLTSCPGLSYLGRPGLEQIRIRSQP